MTLPERRRDDTRPLSPLPSKYGTYRWNEAGRPMSLKTVTRLTMLRER